MKKVVIFESELSYDFNLEMWETYLRLLNETSNDMKYKLLFHDHEASKIYFDSHFIKYEQDLDRMYIFIVPDTIDDSPELRKLLQRDIPEEFIGIPDIMDNRECPLLIEVIETCTLGKYNDFKVIKVPEDLKYHIGTHSEESYVEVVIENHRTYSSEGLKWVGTTT